MYMLKYGIPFIGKLKRLKVNRLSFLYLMENMDIGNMDYEEKRVVNRILEHSE